jgi:sugar/nucleoside kinase (ribokinase family)
MVPLPRHRLHPGRALSLPVPAVSPILVVGSVALDSIETPFETRNDLLGGAAAHFSIAASLFAPVRLVAVIGRDFPEDRLEVLRRRDIDLAGLSVADGPSFRWRGRYHLDMDHRDTLDLQLGVFADFRPELPPGWGDTPVTFLANIDPDLQLHVLDQANGTHLTACDTIEHWIFEKRDKVDEMLSRVDLVFMNEDEARLYAGTPNLHRAAEMILDRGCRAALIKKGENGSLVVRRLPGGGTETFVCSAYPAEEVVDPTGAGDAFAGGVMGVLAATRSSDLGELRRAVRVGTILASYNVEGFGPQALEKVGMDDVLARYRHVKEMEALPD